jgi:selenocysteine-specific elongation factor
VLADGRVESRGGRWFAASARERIMQRIVAALSEYHAVEPLRPGMPLEVARRAAGRAPGTLVESAIDALLEAGEVERRGAALARAGHRSELAAKDRDLVERALERYGRAGLEPPETPALADELGVDAGKLRTLLRHMEERGRVVKLASDWYADPAALARAERMLVERLGGEEEGADTGAFKELFGVTRKYLIPILEYFDRSGLTRREGNRRVLSGRP